MAVGVPHLDIPSFCGLFIQLRRLLLRSSSTLEWGVLTSLEAAVEGLLELLGSRLHHLLLRCIRVFLYLNPHPVRLHLHLLPPPQLQLLITPLAVLRSPWLASLIPAASTNSSAACLLPISTFCLVSQQIAVLSSSSSSRELTTTLV